MTSLVLSTLPSHRFDLAVAAFVTSLRFADFRHLLAIAEFCAVETGLFISLVLSTFHNPMSVADVP